jgi:hypothetical protein
VTISGEQPDDQASPAARPHHRLRQPEPTVTTNSVMKWYSTWRRLLLIFRGNTDEM